MDKFLNIPLSINNLDSYYIRNAIKLALTNALPFFEGELLDIGCGKMPYKKFVLENSNVNKYVGLDIELALSYDENVSPDFTWDGVDMPFEEQSFSVAIGTEVLEHCPEPEVILKEVHRVLKQNGVFFFTVPFLWNLHETPHDEYRYTPFSLERHLKNSGFSDIKINATGGWHASMAQMLGLWVRRSPMSSRKRNILSKLCKLIIKKLIKLDKNCSVEFKDGQMITGLSGIAYKK